MNAQSRSIMLIAGEVSGDRIAARVVRAAKAIGQRESQLITFFGIGGEECKAEGVECLYHADDMSVVGFVEVAKRFRFFRSVLKRMTSLLDERRPDVLLLIDYPGFNMRLAREAKKRGIKIIYFVSPQVWAWHASRVGELKSLVNEMLVIFPFEEKIYHDAGLKTSYFVGHPLVERIDEERHRFSTREAFAARHGLDADREWLLVMPGSRREEVRRLLPALSSAAAEFAGRHAMQSILVESISIDKSLYNETNSELKRFRNPNATHELMQHAKIGILKSGTTTLEAALLGLPGVICYKTHPLTFFLGKRLVKLPYIGLANIVKGSKLYPELLQHEATDVRIVNELESIYKSANEFRLELKGLAESLCTPHGTPSELVARRLF